MFFPRGQIDLRSNDRRNTIEQCHRTDGVIILSTSDSCHHLIIIEIISTSGQLLWKRCEGQDVQLRKLLGEVIFHRDDDRWRSQIDFIQNDDQLFLVNARDVIVERRRKVKNL